MKRLVIRTAGTLLGAIALTALAFVLGKATVFAGVPLSTNDETNAPVIHHTEWTPPENVLFTSAPITLKPGERASGTDYVMVKADPSASDASKYDPKGEVMRFEWEAEHKLAGEAPPQYVPGGVKGSETDASPDYTSATCSQKYTAYGQVGQALWDYKATTHYNIYASNVQITNVTHNSNTYYLGWALDHYGQYWFGSPATVVNSWGAGYFSYYGGTQKVYARFDFTIDRNQINGSNLGCSVYRTVGNW
jgi:hypothetical protein